MILFSFFHYISPIVKFLHLLDSIAFKSSSILLELNMLDTEISTKNIFLIFFFSFNAISESPPNSKSCHLNTPLQYLEYLSIFPPALIHSD